MYYLIAIAIVGIFFVGDTVMISSENKYDDLFKKYAAVYNLDWKMLKTICYIESNLGRATSVARGLAAPNDIEGSKSSDGKSWGLMQLTLSTAADFDSKVTVAKLNDPDYSVKIAAQYVRYLKNYYASRGQNVVEYVVKSYNQGQGNTNKEINGTGGGYANGYWLKYINIYQGV